MGKKTVYRPQITFSFKKSVILDMEGGKKYNEKNYRFIWFSTEKKSKYAIITRFLICSQKDNEYLIKEF